jgi:hypothetical protein
VGKGFRSNGVIEHFKILLLPKTLKSLNTSQSILNRDFNKRSAGKITFLPALFYSG